MWLKYYCHAARTLICSSHADDWGIIVHLSIQSHTWCHHSLPVAVDYTWVSRSVKIHMSHVALVCFCVSLSKVKRVAGLCDVTDDKTQLSDHWLYDFGLDSVSVLCLELSERFLWTIVTSHVSDNVFSLCNQAVAVVRGDYTEETNTI